jgi:CRP/FNR family cyclic AMP-dependent transcriptional regulator
MSDVDLIAKVSLFSFMTKRDLQRIANLARHHIFRQGDVIIKEGERDGRLFIIVQGEVEVIKNLGSKNQKRLNTLGPTMYFGEMALIDDLVRSASVIAKDNARLLSLEQWNLRQEIEKYPIIAVELLQMLSRRIRAIEKRMTHTLGSILPICASCKKIREDNDVWIAIEEYIAEHSEAEFSHGVCPGCAIQLYPELYQGNRP